MEGPAGEAQCLQSCGKASRKDSNGLADQTQIAAEMPSLYMAGGLGSDLAVPL